MKYHKYGYLFLSFVLFISLLSISPDVIKAADNNTFTDVTDTHWAYQHILKMELRGIVTGYTDGQFRPEKAVSQLEAIIMAIRQMGLQDQINTVDASSIDSNALGLPKGWDSEKYVAFALEKEIIDLDSFEPNTAASRAWVARMVIRMIGEEQSVEDNKATDFFDDLQIPTWAKGYVSLAVEKNIVTGSFDAVGRKVFNPHDYVTRAQLATMISRSDEFMKDSDTVLTGVLEGVNGQYISIKNSENEVRSYLISNQLLVFNEKGEKSILEQLIKGDSIRFEKDKLGYIAYIEKVEPSSIQTNLTGTVVQLFNEDLMITIKDENGKLTIYHFAQGLDTSKITIGEVIEFVIDYNHLIKSYQISNDDQALKGIIYSLDLNTNILVVESNEQYQAYTMAEPLSVEYQGIRFPNVKDLQKGDQVELVVNENNQIQTIRMIQPYQVLEMNGKIAVISKTEQIITVRLDDNSLKAFDAASELEIYIEGISQPTFEDLLVGDAIQFTTQEGEITKLSVNNRSYINEIKGIVKSIDTINGYLTIENAEKKLVTFPIDSYVTIDLDINDPELIDVEIGDKVILTIENNKIYKIKLDNTLEGKLISVDDREEKIVIQTELEGKRTFLLAPDVDVDIVNVRYPDLGDLTEGDELVLIFDQDLVTDIRVKKEWTTEIVEVNTLRNRVTIKDGNTEKIYSIHSGIKLVIPNIVNPKLDDINAGDTIKLMFYGNELIQVSVVPPHYGYVTSINLFQKQLYYHTDNTQKVVNTNNVIMYNNENLAISLQQLTKDDYIKVIEINDEIVITQAKKITGSLTTINLDNGKIYILDNNNVYQFYALSEKVEVFKGTTNYDLGDLQPNQAISIYTIDDKVVAIKIN